MTAKQRPPLTPTESTYVGLARIAGAEAAPVEAGHLLRWPSRSRPSEEHFSSCDERGGDVRCTCEAWTYRDACGHAAGHLDALAHHGVTFGAAPADPGGAVGGPREPAGLAECEDWDTVELSPEHPGGFWTATAYGPMHVSGDPHMADETLDALREMAELAVRQHLDPAPNALDALVTAGGDRWIASRTHAGVRLVCAGCGSVRGWATEGEASTFLAGGGACGCDGGGPTPPAPGAARKSLQDHLNLLYGEA